MGAVASTNIVTDGLVYCIDAANKRCYSGTGTTGVDLVKGGTTTLTNQVTFGSNNMGVFAFDGTDDYIEQDWSFTLGTGDLTMEFWVKMEGWIIHSQGANVFLSVTDPNVHEELQFGIENSTAQRLALYLDGGSNGSKTGDGVYSWSTDQWYHLVATRISSTVALYRDGVSLTVATGATNTGDVAAISTFLLGNQYKSGEKKHDFQGDMGPIRIYNKGLTAAEVLQNYEATKPRFTPRITKSNLELNFDAGDPQSYSGGTTWKDTASGISAVLQNMEADDFNSSNGGYLEFDGTDEFAIVAQSGGWSMQGWAALTMETWINVAGNRWHRILYENQNQASTYGYRVATDLYNANSAFWLHAGSSVAVQQSIVSLDTWFQYVCRWDGTTMNVYKNGVKVGGSGTSNSGTIQSSSGSKGGVAIAAGWNSVNGLQSASETLYGKMGLLRVYQGALSDAEILDNYNKTKARFGH